MTTGIFEPTHIALILAIALLALMLSPKRLPAAGRALGSGISNFRHGLTHTDDPNEVGGVGANPTACGSAPARRSVRS
ncbi:MAG: twin-arginine translocase TatA/TatE family subunit [Trebonia sp.]